jgi:hypothetical protein
MAPSMHIAPSMAPYMAHSMAPSTLIINRGLKTSLMTDGWAWVGKQ